MKQKIKNILKVIALTLITIVFCASVGISGYFCYTKYNEEHTKYYVYEEMTILHYNEAKLDLVNAVDEYIQSVSNHSSLNGISVVNACLKHDIDICFVLAQGEVESHFGTKGMARKTNSVWNVLAYDGKSFEQIPKAGKYKTPDESIEPYMNLLQKRYLHNKTENDLLIKFVDKSGHRYASNQNYEATLCKTVKNIKEKTPIDTLMQTVKQYGNILGY